MVWELYEYPPSFVIAFHGCSRETGEAALADRPAHLIPSSNQWDWLGHGIYFWEGNPQRALEWAEASCKEPFVLGAILDLGRCLDLLDSSGLQQVRDAWELVRDAYELAGGEPVPKNRKSAKGMDPDNVVRIRDCLVMNTLHEYRDSRKLPPYETVRAMFPEGEELFEGAGFKDKNHIQICVRPQALHCIKGYFRPIRQT